MKAVLFDLDGTLLDTVPDIRAALNAALEAFGYPPIGYDETVAYVGNGAEKLVERAVPTGGDVRGVLSAFAVNYTNSENRFTRPYEGMADVLDALKVQGVKLAVVTNKLQASAEKVMEEFYPGRFDLVLGDSGLFPCKPDPTSARFAALSLRAPIGECVLVGDGETDVFTARNAGMGAISVLWGYRTRTALEAAGAKIFAARVSDLLPLLTASGTRG